MIFDTHAHYDDPAFDQDRDELVSSLPAKGIFRVVNVTASVESLTASSELAHRYEHVYTSAGLHPTEIYDFDIDVLKRVEELCSDDKTVAIGEIGLDYHYPNTDTAKQKEFFEAQLDMARRLKMPVIIHSRDAAKDTMDILRSHQAGDIGGVVHCYSYSPEMAEEYADMGLYIGVGGVVTYKNGRRLKIYFATQASVCPPTFVLFANEPELMHFSYLRYIENGLRESFDFSGTPIRVIVRDKKEETEYNG